MREDEGLKNANRCARECRCACSALFLASSFSTFSPSRFRLQGYCDMTFSASAHQTFTLHMAHTNMAAAHHHCIPGLRSLRQEATDLHNIHQTRPFNSRLLSPYNLELDNFPESRLFSGPMRTTPPPPRRIRHKTEKGKP